MGVTKEQGQFASILARKMNHRGRSPRGWSCYAGLVGTLVILVAMDFSAFAAPHAVIKLGSRESVVETLGTYEGRSDVLFVEVSSSSDWVCIRLPFKGKMSELKSIHYSVLPPGDATGQQREPYILLKLTESKALVCRPQYSSSGTWSFVARQWQERDAAHDGLWVIADSGVVSLVRPLPAWIDIISDRCAVAISICIGPWDISEPSPWYLGDVSVNGVPMDLSNAARAPGTREDLYPII